ncbi:alanine racemase [Actinokineospora sp.]|uniref:alanine racemase n=1 Tax=Actinokineospora sp. TaxID=1872133 RepID=UPI0040376E44
MVPLPARLDRAAVARLGEERLDWRFKSIPHTWFGRTADEAIAARLGLFRDGFVGPIVALDDAAVEHNLATMAKWTAARGLALAPHGKTTMAPQLFARQLDHGAWALSAATAGQLRVYRAFGVSRVLLANSYLDPAGLAWLGAELDRDPEFEFWCWADSVRGVELMTEALAGTRRPVDVLVEIGVPGGRTGARDADTARAVAAAIVASPALRLAGVGGYEGSAAIHATPAGLDAVAAYLARLRELVSLLHGQFETEQVVVTAGGSAFFDLVADALTAPWPDGLAVLPVLRGGAYITHDDGYYRAVSPLGAHGRLDGVPALRSALRAWTQVISRPEPGLALLAVGKRDVPYDIDLPEPQLLRTASDVGPLTGCRVTALNDQHAFMQVVGARVEVGDWVGLGLSHPCTVFDKWPLLPMTGADGETVVALVRTFF